MINSIAEDFVTFPGDDGENVTSVSMHLKSAHFNASRVQVLIGRTDLEAIFINHDPDCAPSFKALSVHGQLAEIPCAAPPSPVGGASSGDAPQVSSIIN